MINKNNIINWEHEQLKGDLDLGHTQSYEYGTVKTVQAIEKEQNTQYEAFLKYVLVNHNAYIFMIPPEKIHSHSLHLMNWKENEIKSEWYV